MPVKFKTEVPILMPAEVLRDIKSSEDPKQATVNWAREHYGDQIDEQKRQLEEERGEKHVVAFARIAGIVSVAFFSETENNEILEKQENEIN